MSMQTTLRSQVLPAHLPGISVFLPAHNEEGNIERVVDGFRTLLPEFAADYEIIVVNDGSSDRTGEIADRISRSDPHVRVVHHPVNQGYGAAVVSGLRAAIMPYVLLCDGDGQFDPADLTLMTVEIGEHDVVAGKRLHRADHLIRRLNGKAWSILMKQLFGLRLTDIDCGFKLFRRELLNGLELDARGAMITTELLAKLAERGARITEVGVHHLPRRSGEQSGNSPKVVLRAFRELFMLYRSLKASAASKDHKAA
jgi:glycosyltransferase involved in cell wall biosynthesis